MVKIPGISRPALKRASANPGSKKLGIVQPAIGRAFPNPAQ